MNNKFLELIRPVITEDLIRLGNNQDGGYVVNKAAIVDHPLISFGVSVDWSFEEDFFNLTNNKIDMYDGSVSLLKFRNTFLNSLINTLSFPFIVKSIIKKNYFKEYVKNLKKQYKIYNGFKVFVDYKKINFNCKFVSSYRNQNTITLTDILSDYKLHNKSFLKIDIEGHEYRLIDEILNYNNHISGMVIEFHNLDIMFDVFSEQIEKLKKYFYITHVHANNYAPYCNEILSPNCWEITFLNREIPKDIIVEEFKNGIYNKENLDYSNDPLCNDFIIKF